MSEISFKSINDYYHLTDNNLESSLQPFLELASLATEAKVAYISIFDENQQHFVVTKGIKNESISRSGSLCNHTLASDQMIVIDDLTNDPRVPDERYSAYGYYIGVPIKNRNGQNFGTFCVLGPKSKTIGDKEKGILSILGMQLVDLLDRRKTLISFYHKWKQDNHQLNEKLTKVDQVKSQLAHDFRGPVGSLRGVTDLALNGKDFQSEDYLELFQIMDTTTNRLQEMLSHLLNELMSDYNDKSSKQEEVNINHVIDSILDLNDFQSHYGTFDIAYSQLPVVWGVSTEFYIIFQNLIENALKYNFSEDKQIEIFSTETDLEFTFHVKDNGSGIPSDQLSKVFEKHQRLHVDTGVKGTGLGLYNVKSILETTGNKIWVESVSGQGSEFIFSWRKHLVGEEENESDLSLIAS